MELVDSVAAFGEVQPPQAVTLSMYNGAGEHDDVPWLR
jgi:hypothetical protein